MKNTLALILFFIAATSFALDIPTSDGKLLRDCEIKAVEKEGLRVSHKDGTGFLDFDTLPIALQKQYGWTAEKSAARKAERAAEAERQRIAGENARRASEERAAAIVKAEAEEVKREHLRKANAAAIKEEKEKAEKAKEATAKEEEATARKNAELKQRAIIISIIALCVIVFWKIAFLPMRLARGKSNYRAVVIMNIVGLFTGAGWLIALYMALNGGQQPSVVHVTVNNITPPQQPYPVAVPRPVAQVQPVAVPRVVAKPLPPSVNPPPPTA